MKKVFGLIVVCAFALAFVACGGGNAKEAAQAKADSTATADSLAKIEADAAAAYQAKADSTMKADSIAAAAAAVVTKKK